MDAWQRLMQLRLIGYGETLRWSNCGLQCRTAVDIRITLVSNVMDDGDAWWGAMHAKLIERSQGNYCFDTWYSIDDFAGIHCIVLKEKHIACTMHEAKTKP